MRIISGSARGRKLFAPAGEDTRPTADRIRESLFNILGTRVWDAGVLDLFGGTGALALEAMSRGAERAVIVDMNRAAIQAIERNAQGVVGEDYASRVRVIKSDYRSAIGAMKGMQFDIVFLDPPYRMVESYADAISRLQAVDALHEDTIILMERLRENTVAVPAGFEIFDTRSYGETAVDFVRVGKE